MKSGRHRHSMGEKDWKESQSASSNGWTMGVELSPNTSSGAEEYLGGRSPVTAGSSGTSGSELGLFNIDRKKDD